MKQKTLKTACSFQGKGLHSGKYASHYSIINTEKGKTEAHQIEFAIFCIENIAEALGIPGNIAYRKPSCAEGHSPLGRIRRM